MSTPKPSWAAPGFENATPQHEPILLPVKGTIPPWLSGSLYRTGPGTFHIHPTPNDHPKISVSHWFDGLGMNHHFKITPKGEVYYSNRSSSDGRIDYIRQTGRAPSSTFGKHQDPCEQLFKKFFTTFVPHPSPRKPSEPGRDMENISVTLTPNIPGLSSHNNNNNPKSPSQLRYLVAATDSNWLQIIDPKTLEPIQTTTYAQISPNLSGHLSAAHSCTDPLTHEHFNYVQQFSSKAGSSVYKVFKLTPPRSGNSGSSTEEKPKVDILAEITDAPMAYVHSFAITKRCVVLCVWQCDYGENGVAVFKNKDILSSIQKWNPHRDTIFYVISRDHGGVIAKYKAPPFFSFHTINAYETPSPSSPQSSIDITIDISTYETNAILDMLYLTNMRITDPTGKSIESPQARRYILPTIPLPNSSSTTTKTLPPPTPITTQPAHLVSKFSNIELPTINPNFHTSKYQYAYGTHRAETHAPGIFTDKLIKLNMSTHTELVWGAKGYTTGEPIFVPRPNSSSSSNSSNSNSNNNEYNRDREEDDGVILSIVLDGMTHKSMLVVLDARDMKELARAEMDTTVPLGFHGCFAPTPSMAAGVTSKL